MTTNLWQQFVTIIFGLKLCYLTFVLPLPLLNVIILKLNSPVLLNLLPYCQAVGAIRKSTIPILISQDGQCWSCNWECLYCDSSQNIRWNRAWALGKSLGLRLYFIVYPSSRHKTDTVTYDPNWCSVVQYAICNAKISAK